MAVTFSALYYTDKFNSGFDFYIRMHCVIRNASKCSCIRMQCSFEGSVHPSREDIYDAIDFGLRNLNTTTLALSLQLICCKVAHQMWVVVEAQKQL